MGDVLRGIIAPEPTTITEDSVVLSEIEKLHSLGATINFSKKGMETAPFVFYSGGSWHLHLYMYFPEFGNEKAGFAAMKVPDFMTKNRLCFKSLVTMADPEQLASNVMLQVSQIADKAGYPLPIGLMMDGKNMFIQIMEDHPLAPQN